MQHAQDIMMLNLCPHKLSEMRTAPDAPGKEQMGLSKMAHRCTRRLRVLKAVKDLPNGRLHLHIGVQGNRLTFGVTQANWQDQFECSTLGFVEDSSLQPGTQHKQLSLRHRSLQAKQ